MALSTVQKLLQKSPPRFLILASLRNPQTHLSNPTPHSNFPHQNAQLEAKPNENSIINGNPFLCSFEAEKLTHLGSLPFLPISSNGFGLNPILSTGSVPDWAEDEDSGMLADSVKKKRKRKMNKHKYKKLRKRLRKRT